MVRGKGDGRWWDSSLESSIDLLDLCVSDVAGRNLPSTDVAN